jgi:hypothetical protein
MRKLLLAVGVMATALAFAAPAAAQADEDTLIDLSCLTLDNFPTLGGVQGVVLYLDEEVGMSEFDQGRMLSKIVTACPEHRAIVEGWIDMDAKVGLI